MCKSNEILAGLPEGASQDEIRAAFFEALRSLNVNDKCEKRDNENQRAVKRPKGSNPLASSFLMRCSPAATRADCKSAAIRLRGFESRHLNDGSIVQLVECRSPKPKVGGSSPPASA